MKETFDIWLYPEDLKGEDIVVNLFYNDSGYYDMNVYTLPDDWKERVTQNKGKDGKPSIHDLMIEATVSEILKEDI